MTTAAVVQNFEEAQSVLAASLPGYVRRPHQIMLGSQIEQSIESRVTLMAQAGTGTGKSIALLIPAILHAVRNDTRVVIATATKALQEQYKDKDLPFLAQHLGVPFQWAILKGRSNYACEARVRELVTPTRAQGIAVKALRDAEKAGEILDRDGMPAVTDREWQQLSMTANECPGAGNCPFAKAGKCMPEKAKAAAADADVVVTNIAYLLRDLKLRQMTDSNVQLLGEFSQLAIDEAHNLPDAVTSALADSIQLGSFVKLAGDLAGFLEEHLGAPELGNEIGTWARQLFAAIDRLYAAFAAKGGKADPMPLYVDTIPANPQTIIGDILGPLFIGLYQAIEAARTEVVRLRTYDEDVQLARYRLMRRTEDWLTRLHKYTLDEAGETVRWVEQERNQRNTAETKRVLCSAPVKVGQFLRSALWSKVPTILMSATLANGGNFGFMADTMGLDDPATYDAGSPFNYAEQAMLYVPGKNDPSPKDKATWGTWAPQVTRRLVLKSGGDALLLFTSRSAMENAYATLAGEFAQAGIRVLKQGDMPNGQLVAEFKRGGAVLFGLKTFMEGVDIPGKALRLVVLDKLPFSVPTDVVIAARVAAYEKVHGYRSSFGGNRNCPACKREGKTCTGMTIPQMQLVLEQAFGRLIRTVTDTGVVAVLDSRLSATGWGRQITGALPPALHATLAEAEAFLGRATAG